MRLSPSQIKLWKECPQSWHLNYIEGLQVKRTKKIFEIGTYTHELLHVLYQTLKAGGYRPGSDFVVQFMHSRILEDLNDLDFLEDTTNRAEVMALVIPLINRYVTNQSPKIDANIEILMVEHEFFQELDGIILHGFIDLVYRDRKTGQVWVRDHKTSGQKNSWYQDKLVMDEQLLFYAKAVSLELGEPIYNVEINFVNTYKYKNPATDAETFKLFRYSHNEKSVQTWFDNLQLIHEKMQEPKQFKNYSGSCAGCRYFKICSLEARGLGVEGIKKTYFLDNSHSEG